MKHIKLFSTTMLAGALSAVGGEALAFPEAGVRYNVSPGSVTVTSTDTVNPTVLRAVTVTCPENGHLVATATAGFLMSDPTNGGNDRVSATFGITKNSSSLEIVGVGNSYVLSFDNKSEHAVDVPGPIERADTCNKGQTVVYRFSASTGPSVGPIDFVSAAAPKLVVEFFRDQLFSITFGEL